MQEDLCFLLARLRVIATFGYGHFFEAACADKLLGRPLDVLSLLGSEQEIQEQQSRILQTLEGRAVNGRSRMD